MPKLTSSKPPFPSLSSTSLIADDPMSSPKRLVFRENSIGHDLRAAEPIEPPGSSRALF